MMEGFPALGTYVKSRIFGAVKIRGESHPLQNEHTFISPVTQKSSETRHENM